MPLVTMTHEDLPGVEKTVEQNAYRYAWFPEGWRSEDDPDWDGVPPDEQPRSTFHGDVLFLDSPIVPNPAASLAGAAASVDQVEQLIAEASAGFIRSMNPKGTLTPFLDNTSAEQSMLNAVFSMPQTTHEGIFRVTAAGLIANTTGSPVTFTFRLRNMTNSLLLCSCAVVLASDAIGQRPWQLTIVSEGNVFLADGIESVGHLIVGKGNTDPLQQALGQGIVAIGSDPQDWDLTCQASAANGNAECSVYSAQVMYALPGA